MTQEQINKNNTIIAEFDGGKIFSNGTVIFPRLENDGRINCPEIISDLKYHTSFDWLMHVVEKIKHLEFEVNIFSDYTRIDKYRNEVRISELGKNEKIRILIQDEHLITALYIAVTNFITWYNTVKK